MTTATAPFERCTEWFGSRQCQRSADHDLRSLKENPGVNPPGHGTIRSRYERFAYPQPLSAYAQLPGHEVGGQMLSPAAYDALAHSRMTGRPCELVVVGQQVREDGVVLLTYGVTGAYIESATDWRVQDGGHLRLVCPECDGKDGKHSRTCGYGR